MAARMSINQCLMNRRVEFSLNLDNPPEAALYGALTELLRHRRAGEVIRQALTAYLFAESHPRPTKPPARSQVHTQSMMTGVVDEQVREPKDDHEAADTAELDGVKPDLADLERARGRHGGAE